MIPFDEAYCLESFRRLLAADSTTGQYEEVQAARWATMEEILRMIDDGRFIPYEKSLIELLFFRRNHRSAHTRTDPTND